MCEPQTEIPILVCYWQMTHETIILQTYKRTHQEYKITLILKSSLIILNYKNGLLFYRYLEHREW